MTKSHNEIGILMRQCVENMDNDWGEGGGAGSLLSSFDPSPDDSEDDTLDDDCEWRIPRQYHSPAKQQMTVRQKKIGKSNHRLSITSKKLTRNSACQVVASVVTSPRELGSYSSLPTASELSSHASSSSPDQYVYTQTTSTMMVRRPSTTSHRYLDDELSLGPDGSDIFTICDSTNTTHHHGMEEWSNRNNRSSKNNQGKFWDDLDNDSVHPDRTESFSHFCINDGKDSPYSDEQDWSPMEDMTVWSLDWTEQGTSIHSQESSPTGIILQCDWKNLSMAQDSLTTSPHCRWDVVDGIITGLHGEVDWSTTGVSGSDGCEAEEAKSPLLWAGHINRLIHHSNRTQTESKISSSANPRRDSIKSTWRRKREKSFGYPKIHRGEASKAAKFLQLPELNCLPKTKSKSLSRQQSWSEKTAVTDYSTSSDSVHTNKIDRVVPRSHVSWDENSLGCHTKQDDDVAKMIDTPSVRMNRIYDVDCGTIGWDHRLNSSVSGGMWSQCDDDAIDSGSDWILVVVTGWSDVDEMEMFHVHRTVLVETCSFFRQELLDNNIKEEGYSIVELDKSLVPAIPDMLDFIYRYKYSHKHPFVDNSLDPTWTDPATAFSLRHLGDFFGIAGLKQSVDQLFD